MASLASILYAAWRSRQPDPTAVPAWGNAPTEERAAWERVAEVAKCDISASLEAAGHERAAMRLNDEVVREARERFAKAGT